MKAEPLSKELYTEAVYLGITTIELNFSGGSDEGNLNVNVTPNNHEFASKVESWAWDTYSYSGAGDGSDYGDDIVYDIKKKKVTTSEWSMTRQDGDSSEEKFSVE